MLRSDGDFTIYVIQHLSRPGGNPFREITWVNSNLDYFVTNVPSDERNAIAPFMAVGECWQKTGIHGTFNQNEALNAVVALATNNPDYNFRVAELQLSMRTRSVYEMSAPDFKRTA